MACSSLDDIVAEIREAKIAHKVALDELVAAQGKSDAAWGRLAKAQRAAGEYIDQLSALPARPLRMVK